MNAWAALLVSTLVAGCASVPAPQVPDHLFNDRLFGAASQRIDASEVFALSDDMKRYLHEVVSSQVRTKGSQQGLFDALYSKGELKLEYDATMTRNAAQAFDARSGNCLSLVIMTAAFAREMGLPVQFQSALVDDMWGHSGDLQFFIGHVNLSLGKNVFRAGYLKHEIDMTIDFLPPEEIAGMRTRVVSEKTIVAMYMNNRAAELLAQRQMNDAYWWARAAVRQDPGYLSTYNTLGIVYKRHGNPAEAEKALAYVLERDPENTRVMSNLALVLDDLGRAEESKILARKLEKLEPNPPLSFYNRGLAALRQGDFKTARDQFAREIERAPYYHEFHYWIAVAYANLGETDKARKHLSIAMDKSPTRTDYALYAAKLDRINSVVGR
jgi:Tfp pilus assembly protein PilF